MTREEEIQKLFDVIKDNGYKWNSETKTLKKLVEPKFKVGDRIKHKNGKDINGVEQGVILSITDDTYDVAVTNNMGIFVLIAEQDEWELVKDNIKPKFKIGDRIKHKLTGDIYKILFVLSNGYGGGVYDVEVTNELGKSIDVKEQDSYELVPNKFDINTLVPLESKVLVRNVGYWVPAFWGYYSKEYKYPFVVDGGNTFAQCIPYEGNEHLLGTTNDCDEYYKNWE